MVGGKRYTCNKYVKTKKLQIQQEMFYQKNLVHSVKHFQTAQLYSVNPFSLLQVQLYISELGSK